jgi:hypothetical protein
VLAAAPKLTFPPTLSTGIREAGAMMSNATAEAAHSAPWPDGGTTRMPTQAEEDRFTAR